MSSRFGGEGTDQEGCWTQQAEHLQYVFCPGWEKGSNTDNTIARAVAAAE